MALQRSMKRRLLRPSRLALVFASAFFLMSAARCQRGPLFLTRAPFLKDSRVFVPARELCEWLGATIQWESGRSAITVAWRGQRREWSRQSGAVLIRGGAAYLRLRDAADAFGERLSWRKNEAIADFGTPGEDLYTAIPVGWKRPGRPAGLSADQKMIWHWLSRPRSKRVVPGVIVEVRDVHVVDRWARVGIHPLNCVTDDAEVLLEKREGTWRILAGGTDICSDGRNYGIPIRVRRRLGVCY
jgi:hypothetical protein